MKINISREQLLTALDIPTGNADGAIVRLPDILAIEFDDNFFGDRVKKLEDAAEMLWVVIANVSAGDWKKQNQDWQDAAARWRDNYFKVLHNTKETP